MKTTRKKPRLLAWLLAEKERFAVGLSTVAWSQHALAGSLLLLPALGGFASPFLVPRTEKGSLLTRRGARVQMKTTRKKPRLSAWLLCVITYFNTICVHPSKSAYSSFKMRTVEKEKQSPPLGFNWAQHDCITYFDRITHP